MKFRNATILVLLLIMVSATAAWAYNKYRTIEVKVECKDGEVKALVTEDGVSNEYNLDIDPNMEGPVIVTVGEDGVPTVSNELPPEIQAALDNGKYFVEEINEEHNGEMVTFFHYIFDLGESKQAEMKVPFRLEESSSNAPE